MQRALQTFEPVSRRWRFRRSSEKRYCAKREGTKYREPKPLALTQFGAERRKDEVTNSVIFDGELTMFLDDAEERGASTRPRWRRLPSSTTSTRTSWPRCARSSTRARSRSWPRTARGRRRAEPEPRRRHPRPRDDRLADPVHERGRPSRAAHRGGGGRARKAHRARRQGREGADDQLEPAPGRLDREALPGPRPAARRPDPGGRDRPEPRGREVRLAARASSSRRTRPGGSARPASARSRTSRRRSAFRRTSTSGA